MSAAEGRTLQEALSDLDDPHGLELLRLSFEEGDQAAMLLAIKLCAESGLTIPKWAADGFVAAINLVREGHARSWDDVFGRPHRKGAHLGSRQDTLRLLPLVWREVQRILDAEPGTAIDAGLFERVGELFGIGKTRAEELYYGAAAIQGPARQPR